MDTSEQYWLPWLQCYQHLQAANLSSIRQLDEELKQIFPWLLEGVSRFRRPSEQSAAKVKDGGKLKASAYGPGKGIVIDKQLTQATLELSQLLDLDELQCHLLLRRLIKEKGINLSAQAAAGPAAGATPAAAGTSTAATAQIVLHADIVQAVADYYGQERVYLAKCQQFIVMTAMTTSADASQTCRKVLKQLLERQWANNVFKNLEALLSPQGPSTSAAVTAIVPAAAGGATSSTAGPTGSTHLVKPSSFDHHAYLHLLNERCELMCLLTQLYCGVDPLTSPTGHALKATASAGEAAGSDESEPQDGAMAAAAAEAAAALVELGSLQWPQCNEDQFLKLLQLLGDAVYAAAAGLAAAVVPDVQLPWATAGAANGGSNNSSKSQAVVLQQLAEAMGTSLVLAALQPAQLLEQLAAAAKAANGGQLPRLTTSFTHWRSIGAALMQWRPVPGNALALLVVHAYNQMLTYGAAGGVEALPDTLQERGMEVGGFSAPRAALALEELTGGSLAGGLHRGLLLQGLSLMASACVISPWQLPAALLEHFIKLIGDLVEGCPHLAEQVWDPEVISLEPLRRFMEETCDLFPAYLWPFLQLATGLTQGPAAAAACYDYLCDKPGLAVEYPSVNTPGLQVLPGGARVLAVDDMPWPKAPEVAGTTLPAPSEANPEGMQGVLRQLPAFARPPPTVDQDMEDGSGAATDGGSGPILVSWEVAAGEGQGTGPVVLLARAASCLHRIHAAEAARQAVADSNEWQDLRLILQLIAALLRWEPMLVHRLLAVTIDYNNGQTLDWVDVIIAALNVLPGLAIRTAKNAAAAEGSYGPVQPSAAGIDRNKAAAFCLALLSSLSDCLTAVAAAASCQPGRVLTALGNCQLFEGAVAAPQPLPMVPLDDLAGWVQHQQQGHELAWNVDDWSQLGTLQSLQEMVEVPFKTYPLTEAVINLTWTLLLQQATWGPVCSLVGFALHRVLGAMPWLPFSDPAARCRVAAAALSTVRCALLSGSVGMRGLAGPKGLGPPGGLMITVLAAKVIHHLATAGHGYLASVLPPAAEDLKVMAEHVTGSSQLLDAGTELAQQVLLLVPLLLSACAHLSPEMPLQQFWAAEPPGGGMRPAAIIASYIMYPYKPHLQLLACDALNAFAILRAPALRTSGKSGYAGGAPHPSGGGPSVPVGPSATSAGVGALQGPIQPGLNPARAIGWHPHGAMAATGQGVASQGGAGGWWRPSGLFAALLASLPGLKQALIMPMEPTEAVTYPDKAIRSFTLLEAGVRFYPEILDSLCFPTGLSLPADVSGGDAAAASTPAPASGTGVKATTQPKAFSALDGLMQLLRQAPQLITSSPKLLAAVMRTLSVLWECQTTAHGAVELLRSQQGFWHALKACLPVSAHLPSFKAKDGLAAGEEAAWRLQVHASTLHIMLLELLSLPQAGADHKEAGSRDEAEQGRASLLAALGPKEVAQLLLTCADLGVEQPLLSQLANVLQVAYLQLGPYVGGAWGLSQPKSDILRVAAQFRAEVAPLLEAVAAGRYSFQDLNAACQLLANDVTDSAAEAASGSSGQESPFGAGGAGAGGDTAARGRALMDFMSKRPFGELLLSYVAVTPYSWSAGDTEYGRNFLFDPDRLNLVLGPLILDEAAAAAGLFITLEEVSVAASVAHARLVLLQAATSLFTGLGRLGQARQQLVQPEVSCNLVKNCVEAVDKSLSEAIQLAGSSAGPLLLEPWGLHFISHASSAAMLLAARALLLSVRIWKAAAAGAALAAAGNSASSSSSGGRPVLMARTLNHQDSLGRQQQQQPSKAIGAGGADGAADADGDAAVALCIQCAALLSRYLRWRGGNSLREAAAAAAAGDATAAAVAAGNSTAASIEEHVEVIECLSTSLLMMLQALPGQKLSQARAAAAAARAAAGAGDSPAVRGSARSAVIAAAADAAAADEAAAAAASPVQVLELESALLDLLPALCEACAFGVSQQEHAAATAAAISGAANGSGAAAPAVQARQAYVAAMVQLLIEILQHQLSAPLWLTPVSQHLALVPMLTAAAARAGASGPTALIVADTGSISAVPGSGSSDPAAAAATVTDISVLELLQAVAEAPQGALQLWQQDVLPVLTGLCRQLLHAQHQSGLLDAAALGFVGPDQAVRGSAAGGAAAKAAASGLDLPSSIALSISTLGAYAATGSAQLPASGFPHAAAFSSSHGSGGSSSNVNGIIWSPRHQQWCLALGLWGSLLLQLNGNAGVADIALELLIAAEPRLLLAVQLQSSNHKDNGSPGSGKGNSSKPASAPSNSALMLSSVGLLSAAPMRGRGLEAVAAGSGSSRVLLTLGNLLEAERSLFLLRFMVQHSGEWQLQRPGSMAAFRAAAASLVEFVAQPSLDRPFRVSCAPLSPFERRLAKLPSGLEATEGWFKLCAAGGANQLHLRASASSSAAAAAAFTGTSGSAGAAGGSGQLALVRVGEAGVSSAGAGDAAAAGGAAAAAGSCSEYCARLGEAVYTACEHALMFLAATAPAVDPSELAVAGPMWPSVKALTALQDQVLVVGDGLVRDPHTLNPRRSRVAAMCCHIAAAAGQLLEALSPDVHCRPGGRAGPAGAGTTGAGGSTEVARRLDRMTSIQRAASLAVSA